MRPAHPDRTVSVALHRRRSQPNILFTLLAVAPWVSAGELRLRLVNENGQAVPGAGAEVLLTVWGDIHRHPLTVEDEFVVVPSDLTAYWFLQDVVVPSTSPRILPTPEWRKMSSSESAKRGTPLRHARETDIYPLQIPAADPADERRR
jgi:hypothetical protein